MKRVLALTACFAASLLASPNKAEAQFSGFNSRGDYGIQAASQPPPGWYFSAPTYVLYHTGTFKDANGDAVLPDRRDSIDVNAVGLGLIFVGEFKLFGGNYSFQVFPTWTDDNLEIPLFSLDERSSLGFADLYLQPINLGWHTERADYTAGLGVYIPTGKYEFLADDNVGLGMWGFELFGGSTVFFGQEKRWSFAAMAFYETHSKKKGTDIRVGDLFTVEGGLGWSFLDGAANVGVAYFGQWKVNNDDLGFDLDQLLEDIGLGVLTGLPIGRNRVYGIGPDLSLPIATKSKLIATLEARFVWDFGARTELEGRSFIFTATFPIPSVSVQ